MEFKGTPGPWYCPPDSVGGVSRTTVWSGNGDIQIAECKSKGLALACNRANARLIAAAPELLEALQGVVRVADRVTVEFDAARAAIAKALGEKK